MVATDDICVLTRFLHIVLSAHLNMMSQSVVRLALMFVERPYQRRIIFRTQIGRTEGYIPAEEELVVKTCRTGTAYAKAHAL